MFEKVIVWAKIMTCLSTKLNKNQNFVIGFLILEWVVEKQKKSIFVSDFGPKNEWTER